MKSISTRFTNLLPWLIGICTVGVFISEKWIVWMLGFVTVALLLGFLSLRLRPAVIMSVPLHLPLLLLLLLCGLSLLFITPLPGLSALPAARLLLGIILFLAWSGFPNSHRALHFLIISLALAGLALALLAPFFTQWADKFTFFPLLSSVLLPKNLPAVSNAFNANVTGGVFASLLALAAGALFWGWGTLSGWARLALLLLFALLAFDLALTQARTAILVSAASMAVLVFQRWKWTRIMIVLGTFAAGGLVIYLGPQFIWQNLLGATGGSGTLTLREEIWLRTRLLIADFPLTGIGLGLFPFVVNLFYPLGRTVNHAHNLYLQLAADFGLPGLVAWLACFFASIAMAWQLLRAQPMSPTRTASSMAFYNALGAATLAFNGVLALHGLLDCVFWDTRPAVLVWAVWGLIAAGFRLMKEEKTLPTTADTLKSAP